MQAMISISGMLVGALILSANILLGFVVYQREPQKRINQLFFLLATTITSWALLSVISDSSSNFLVAKYTSSLAFGASFLAMGTAYVFAHYYAHESFGRKRAVVFMLGVVAGAVLFSTPLVYDLTTPDTYKNGPLYIPYLLGMVTILVFVIRNFRAAYRQGNPLQRNQILFILSGFFTMAVLALITNAIIPAVVDVTWVTKLGPLFSIIFVAAIAYAIIKHRLFDIRLALARSTAYFLAIGTITIGYLAIVLTLSHVFIHDVSISLKYQLINVAIAIFVGFTFQPIKRFFDRITDRIFFRDSYDSQELLDSLNRLFVANTNLEQLLKNSATIIETSLRAEFCFFGIWETDRMPLRIIGNGVRKIDAADIAALRKATLRMQQKLIITDDLTDSHEAILHILQTNDIAIIGRLTTNVTKPVEGMGYLVLGPRRSGNPYSAKDLRTLEIIVNELVIATENSLRFEEIQHFNETLQLNVNDATRKLRRTNDKLQQLDATKDEFITMASHQLRTPLTSVKGYLSMVLEGDAGKLNAQQQQLLNQSYASAQRMVFLISDLLNLSRLNTGKFVIEPSPVDLRNVVQAEIDQLRETAKARDVTLTYENPASFPTLMLDETKIHQVVMNFIDNAIYYTPSGGAIHISLRETPANVEYLVKDNGIGVPKAEQHKLFTKFYRAGNARQARPDGTGLGLFMAKKVIAAQGGAILFESEEGKGSTFGFRFSKAKHLAPGAPAKPSPETATTKV